MEAVVPIKWTPLAADAIAFLIGKFIYCPRTGRLKPTKALLGPRRELSAVNVPFCA
jgi:hypothetical protein